MLALLAKLERSIKWREDWENISQICLKILKIIRFDNLPHYLKKRSISNALDAQKPSNLFSKLKKYIDLSKNEENNDFTPYCCTLLTCIWHMCDECLCLCDPPELPDYPFTWGKVGYNIYSDNSASPDSILSCYCASSYRKHILQRRSVRFSVGGNFLGSSPKKANYRFRCVCSNFLKCNVYKKPAKQGKVK